MQNAIIVILAIMAIVVGHICLNLWQLKQRHKLERCVTFLMARGQSVFCQ